MTGYELPLAAFHKVPIRRLPSCPGEQRFTYEGVHIVQWTNDADHEPIAVYINDKTGDVRYDFSTMFTTKLP